MWTVFLTKKDGTNRKPLSAPVTNLLALIFQLITPYSRLFKCSIQPLRAPCSFVVRARLFNKWIQYLFICRPYIYSHFWLAMEAFIFPFIKVLYGSCSLTHSSTCRFEVKPPVIASLNSHYFLLPLDTSQASQLPALCMAEQRWPLNEYTSSPSAPSSWFVISSVLWRFMSACEQVMSPLSEASGRGFRAPLCAHV